MTLNEFFLILAKKIVRGVETVIWVYRGITSKKLLNNWFFVFFGFWQEKPVFLHESFWQCCQKYFRRVQWNTYRATIPNESLEDSRIFEYVLKFSAQWRQTFFGVGRTAIDVRGKSLWIFFFKREKFAFFPIPSECLLPEKIFARVAKPAIYVSVEVFGKKRHFLKYI